MSSAKAAQDLMDSKARLKQKMAALQMGYQSPPTQTPATTLDPRYMKICAASFDEFMGYSTTPNANLVKNCSVVAIPGNGLRLDNPLSYRTLRGEGLTRLAVMKGDLIDLLAVKLNAQQIYSDAYSGVKSADRTGTGSPLAQPTKNIPFARPTTAWDDAYPTQAYDVMTRQPTTPAFLVRFDQQELDRQLNLMASNELVSRQLGTVVPYLQDKHVQTDDKVCPTCERPTHADAACGVSMTSLPSAASDETYTYQRNGVTGASRAHHSVSDSDSQPDMPRPSSAIRARSRAMQRSRSRSLASTRQGSADCSCAGSDHFASASDSARAPDSVDAGASSLTGVRSARSHNINREHRVARHAHANSFESEELASGASRLMRARSFREESKSLQDRDSTSTLSDATSLRSDVDRTFDESTGFVRSHASDVSATSASRMTSPRSVRRTFASGSALDRSDMTSSRVPELDLTSSSRFGDVPAMTSSSRTENGFTTTGVTSPQPDETLDVTMSPRMSQLTSASHLTSASQCDASEVTSAASERRRRWPGREERKRSGGSERVGRSASVRVSDVSAKRDRQNVASLSDGEHSGEKRRAPASPEHLSSAQTAAAQSTHHSPRSNLGKHGVSREEGRTEAGERGRLDRTSTRAKDRDATLTRENARRETCDGGDRSSRHTRPSTLLEN